MDDLKFQRKIHHVQWNELQIGAELAYSPRLFLFSPQPKSSTILPGSIFGDKEVYKTIKIHVFSRGWDGY